MKKFHETRRFLLIYSLFFFFSLFFLFSAPLFSSPVLIGADLLFTPEYVSFLKGKRIGLIANHTSLNSQKKSTIESLKENSLRFGYRLERLFAPEHGLNGAAYAWEEVKEESSFLGVPLSNLQGKRQRPTKEMLQSIDLLIYDIQDIGSRSYTYVSTLFYVMEEAAKLRIPVMVLDRPNPINGVIVDGPLLDESLRSSVGYINTPYCHGMTSGELARFFNEERQIGCDLTVIPMRGWKRTMSFADTKLTWAPTSPYIPEADTPLFYPITGILGELQIVNIGIGYTLPFKVIGAPWINARLFAEALNKQKFPGVFFLPFYYRPFYGRFARQLCQGVLIHISDPLIYKPVSTQYLIIGVLKSLYPSHFQKALEASKARKEMFCKVAGSKEIYRLIAEEKNIVWKLREWSEKDSRSFETKRKRYLIPSYLPG